MTSTLPTPVRRTSLRPVTVTNGVERCLRCRQSILIGQKAFERAQKPGYLCVSCASTGGRLRPF